MLPSLAAARSHTLSDMNYQRLYVSFPIYSHYEHLKHLNISVEATAVHTAYILTKYN